MTVVRIEITSSPGTDEPDAAAQDALRLIEDAFSKHAASPKVEKRTWRFANAKWSGYVVSVQV